MDSIDPFLAVNPVTGLPRKRCAPIMLQMERGAKLPEWCFQRTGRHTYED